ncbi:MAG: FxsA family protein, partial [Octadecabacter sp.]|nr:FxsA family protein [Octadecabacter sp.]
LLLTPGFFTDAIGFALLVPGIRAALLREVKKRVEVQQAFTRPQPDMGRNARQPHHPDVVEGSFTETDASDDGPSRGSSGWTRH